MLPCRGEYCTRALRGPHRQRGVGWTGGMTHFYVSRTGISVNMSYFMCFYLFLPWLRGVVVSSSLKCLLKFSAEEYGDSAPASPPAWNGLRVLQEPGSIHRGK